MPLSFPPTPATDEVYTFNGRSWVFNGTAWDYRPEAGIIRYPIDSLFLVQQSLSLTDTDALTNTEVQYI